MNVFGNPIELPSLSQDTKNLNVDESVVSMMKIDINVKKNKLVIRILMINLTAKHKNETNFRYFELVEIWHFAIVVNMIVLSNNNLDTVTAYYNKIFGNKNSNLMIARNRFWIFMVAAISENEHHLNIDRITVFTYILVYLWIFILVRKSKPTSNNLQFYKYWIVIQT